MTTAVIIILAILALVAAIGWRGAANDRTAYRLVADENRKATDNATIRLRDARTQVEDLTRANKALKVEVADLKDLVAVAESRAKMTEAALDQAKQTITAYDSQFLNPDNWRVTTAGNRMWKGPDFEFAAPTLQ